MAKLSISMSDTMNAFVAERVKSGQYNNTSEYFRDLVRRDQERRQAEDDLRRMLEDAEASGVSGRTPEEIWDTTEAAVRNQYVPTALRSPRIRKPRQQPD